MKLAAPLFWQCFIFFLISIVSLTHFSQCSKAFWHNEPSSYLRRADEAPAAPRQTSHPKPQTPEELSGQPSQPLKGLQSLSSLREDHPRTSCLSQYAPSSAGMRDGPEDCVDYVFEGYAGPRLFPLHHDSWTRDFSRSSPGVPTATAGPDNTLQRLFLRGNSKPRLYEHIHRRVAKAPARSNAPAGTRGKCSSHGPALQTKSDPRSPPGARGRGDTRRGGARRGLPPGAGGGGGGGSRGTYKSRVPPEEPGRVFRAAAGVGARRGAAATTTTTTNSRAQNR